MQFITSKKQKEQKIKRFSSYQWAVSPFISDAVFHEVSAANEQSLIRGFIGKLKQMMAYSLFFTLTFFSFISFINSSYANTVVPVRFSESFKLSLANSNDKTTPSFSFNPHSMVMAIAENDKSAKALAKKEREVYYLFAGQSVRQTIDRWAAINHFKVIYQTDVNFTVAQDTTVYGGFLSKGGALAQLLGSLKNTSNPIKATATSNHVLLIQANEYNPALLMPNRNNANNTNTGA